MQKSRSDAPDSGAGRAAAVSWAKIRPQLQHAVGAYEDLLVAATGPLAAPSLDEESPARALRPAIEDSQAVTEGLNRAEALD